MKDKFAKMCKCAKSCVSLRKGVLIGNPSDSGDDAMAPVPPVAMSEELTKKQGVPKGADQDTHERCIKKVKVQGHDKSSAYAICNAAKAGMKKGDVIDAKDKFGIKSPATEPKPKAGLSENQRKFVDAVKNQRASAREKWDEKTKSRDFKIKTFRNYASSWANSMSQSRYDPYHKKRAVFHWHKAKKYAKENGIHPTDFSKIMKEHLEAETGSSDMGQFEKSGWKPHMSE